MPNPLRNHIAKLAAEAKAASARMPSPVASREAIAEGMGLDPHLTFQRADSPGKQSFSDARGRMYAAPTAWQAKQASQTGGRSVYPLWLPTPIFGLHHNPKLHGITDEWLKGVTYEDWLDDHGHVQGAHLAGTPDGKFAAGLLEAIEGINDRFRASPRLQREARESFLDANADFLNWNKPERGLTAWDFRDAQDPDPPVAASNPLKQHMRNIGAEFNPRAMDHLAEALQYQYVDGAAPFMLERQGRNRLVHEGTGDLLKALGYAGTLVDDEGGMSVVSFMPARVRHATQSALDPSQRNRAGIYRSIAPIATGGGLLGGLTSRSEEQR